MKIALILTVVLGIAGLLYAASVPLASGPSVMTSAVLNATPPNYSGQPIICSDCGAANAGKYNYCVSSGTGAGAWVLISSAAAITQCK